MRPPEGAIFVKTKTGMTWMFEQVVSKNGEVTRTLSKGTLTPEEEVQLKDQIARSRVRIATS